MVTFMVKGLPQHNGMLEPGIFGYCIFQQNSSHLCCISSCFKKRINIRVNGWCGVQAILQTRWAMFKTPHLRLASNSYLLHCIGGFIGGVTHQICKICACQGTQSCPKLSKACPAQVSLSIIHPSSNIYRLILSSVSQSYHPKLLGVWFIGNDPSSLLAQLQNLIQWLPLLTKSGHFNNST